MTSLEAALRQIYSDLAEAHVSFAPVGGLAVCARTEPRFTRDADLAVAVASDAEAEALIHRLPDRHVVMRLAELACGRASTLSSKLRSPGSVAGTYTILMERSGSAAAEMRSLWKALTRIEVRD